VGTDEIRLRVTSAESDGRLLAAEVTMPAGGGPPMLHRHEAAEVYRVESGELTMYVQDASGRVARVIAAPGETVHIPGGQPHTIRNEGADTATAYVVFVPGAEMEGFVRDVAGLSTPDPQAVMAIAERHGVCPAGALAP
jgi:oxalate decarboxylase/phosphoglucose isomerase-like protein (cupin superfamily)